MVQESLIASPTRDKVDAFDSQLILLWPALLGLRVDLKFTGPISLHVGESLLKLKTIRNEKHFTDQ